MTDGSDDPHDAALGHVSETASDYDDGKGFDVEAWAEEAEEEMDNEEREAIESMITIDDLLGRNVVTDRDLADDDSN